MKLFIEPVLSISVVLDIGEAGDINVAKHLTFVLNDLLF